jgi:Mn-dependent DtxR family transcriptional regulator
MGLLSTTLNTVADSPQERIRWTRLVQRLSIHGSTQWRINTMVDWLRRAGYINRPSRGLYALTDKGRRLREAVKDLADRRIPLIED